MRIAPEAKPIVASLVIISFFCLLSAWYSLFFLFALVAAATAFFFRDPQRIVPPGPEFIVSAADGRIVDISETRLQGYEEPFQRVCVFMSLLNVHVNRSPVDAEVVSVEHFPGQFLAAFKRATEELNERKLVILQDRSGRHFGVMQIAGFFARRIVCRLQPRQWVNKGDRIGLIMFGSRVVHYLPRDVSIVVKVGDKVRAGETIIGELKNEDFSR